MDNHRAEQVEAITESLGSVVAEVTAEAMGLKAQLEAKEQTLTAYRAQILTLMHSLRHSRIPAAERLEIRITLATILDTP